jgi:hypothetical protein
LLGAVRAVCAACERGVPPVSGHIATCPRDGSWRESEDAIN